MPKTLKPEDYQEVERWLLAQNIKLNNRTRRDFSDVLPVATIIKNINAKVVDLNNYPSRSSYILKLANWETFNHKVLSKVGLQQHKRQLEQLAQGSVGAIEHLLHEIMLYERFAKSKRSSVMDNSSAHDCVLPPGDPLINYARDVVTVDIDRYENGVHIKVPQKMIDYEIFERIARQCNEKDAYIQRVEEKSFYLEKVLKNKEARIEELVQHLSKLTSLAAPTNANPASDGEM